MTLKIIISGGQTGVDQAGLRAARRAKIATGGMMPHGFRTQAGPNPKLAQLYGLREHASASYHPRTECNVRDSDVTLILGNSASTGCTLTIRYCAKHNKPMYHVPFDGGLMRVYDAAVLVRKWIEKVNPSVLNVAGNREESYPGIGQWAEDVIYQAIIL